ncbi:hypothetical protein N7527_011707 [Penicillium freii]|uniref:Uncharacterized protein n=1 Tax=Penicillium freii TaxID=48697 RepID=A0A101M8X3_PENFR|nr:hypothetical protein N7527_011707 [Penicillium freii]KUM55995.1 hypothetical protein ACN42_g11232 [Penicillium freii]
MAIACMKDGRVETTTPFTGEMTIGRLAWDGMHVHKVVVANRLLLVIYFITNYIHIDRSYPPLYITISMPTEEVSDIGVCSARPILGALYTRH